MISNVCMPSTVTLFHKRGEENKIVDYSVFFLINVRLDERDAISQNKFGEKTLETFRLTVDKDVSFVKHFNSPSRVVYAPAEKYKEMLTSEQFKHWTISEGDIIIPEKIPTLDCIRNIVRLKDKFRFYTVNSFSAVYGSNGLDHVEVSGRGKLLE